MPVHYEYIDNKQGVIITALGIVEGEEFINVIKELFSHKETIQNYKYGLVDYTQLDKFDISITQISELANIHIESSKLNPEIIVGFAIIKPVIHGLVRVWMAYATITGWRVNIKKTVPDIKRWIDSQLAQN